jgi:hypothetical protein
VTTDCPSFAAHPQQKGNLPIHFSCTGETFSAFWVFRSLRKRSTVMGKRKGKAAQLTGDAAAGTSELNKHIREMDVEVSNSMLNA